MQGRGHACWFCSLGTVQPTKHPRSQAHGQPLLLTPVPSATLPTHAQVVSMVTRQPALLLLDPASVAAKVTAISSLLGISYPMAVCVVANAPALLGRHISSLQRKHAKLQRLLRQPAARVSALVMERPSMLTVGEAHLEGSWQQLQEALGGLPPAALAQLLMGQPSLLLRSPRQLQVGGRCWVWRIGSLFACTTSQRL